jgi:hypothetical protein
MNYHFSRKHLAALAVCLVLLILFSFSAGLVAGVGLWMPTRQELAMLKHNRPPQAVLAAQPLVSPSAKPAGAPVEPSAAPLKEQPTKEQPTPDPASTEAEGDLFALQVGSFLDPKNARQLQADLKDRGYNTNVVTALDAEQREWHVVRMGAYKTLESAARAAAEFSGKSICHFSSWMLKLCTFQLFPPAQRRFLCHRKLYAEAMWGRLATCGRLAIGLPAAPIAPKKAGTLGAHSSHSLPTRQPRHLNSIRPSRKPPTCFQAPANRPALAMCPQSGPFFGICTGNS